uniref:Uncharacterized protein n=1 Tax=Arundo donax TaxID=35708 RepID=A0A0A8ZX91_ARUDO
MKCNGENYLSVSKSIRYTSELTVRTI